MDRHGHIYEVDEAKSSFAELAEQVREDKARLDGYLRARAEIDEPKRDARLAEELARAVAERDVAVEALRRIAIPDSEHLGFELARAALERLEDT